MAEEIRCAAFESKGIGMPKSGLGNVLSNDAFLKFQREFLTPFGTIVSLSNFRDPHAAILKIKQKIRERYPECTTLAIQSSKEESQSLRFLNTKVESIAYCLKIPLSLNSGSLFQDANTNQTKWRCTMC